MAYFDVFQLTTDSDFTGRVAACYATENGPGDPYAWAGAHAWEMAAQPGFGDAYAYALAGGNTHPGSDPAVITDAMILSAAQSIIAESAPPAEGS